MRRIIQEDKTGCGLACIAMLSGRKYKEIRKVAVTEHGFDEDGEFYTQTKHLTALGQRFGLEIGSRRRKFKDYSSLPDRAILAINYKEATDTWHRVIFHRTAKEEYVLDPKQSIKTAKRKDLSRISRKATYWLGVRMRITSKGTRRPKAARVL